MPHKDPAERKKYQAKWRSKWLENEEYREQQRLYRARPEVKKRRRETLAAWREKNRGRLKEAQNRHNEKNPTARKTAMLKFHYGITFEQYTSFVKRADGLCEICSSPPGTTRQTKLHLDHDHRSGKPRGILCHKCNRGLGLFNDSPSRLERAAKYLRERMNNDFLLKDEE